MNQNGQFADNNTQFDDMMIGAIKIKDGLFIGDELAAKDLEFIVTNKVTHVINTAGKQIPNLWENMNIAYLTLFWSESDQQVLFDPKNETINEIVDFINEAHEQGESVLVHSVRGQSRACCVLVSFFMIKYQWNLYKTLQFLNSRRPDLEIRASFFHQITELEKKLQSQKLGAKYSSWDDIQNIDPDDLLLRNTFINAKNAPFADYLINIRAQSPQKKKKNKLVWADENKQKLSQFLYQKPQNVYTNIKKQSTNKQVIKSIVKGSNNCYNQDGIKIVPKKRNEVRNSDADLIMQNKNLSHKKRLNHSQDFERKANNQGQTLQKQNRPSSSHAHQENGIQQNPLSNSNTLGYSREFFQQQQSLLQPQQIMIGGNNTKINNINSPIINLTVNNYMNGSGNNPQQQQQQQNMSKNGINNSKGVINQNSIYNVIDNTNFSQQPQHQMPQLNTRSSLNREANEIMMGKENQMSIYQQSNNQQGNSISQQQYQQNFGESGIRNNVSKNKNDQQMQQQQQQGKTNTSMFQQQNLVPYPQQQPHQNFIQSFSQNNSYNSSLKKQQQSQMAVNGSGQKMPPSTSAFSNVNSMSSMISKNNIYHTETSYTKALNNKISNKYKKQYDLQFKGNNMGVNNLIKKENVNNQFQAINSKFGGTKAFPIKAGGHDIEQYPQKQDRPNSAQVQQQEGKHNQNNYSQDMQQRPSSSGSMRHFSPATKLNTNKQKTNNNQPYSTQIGGKKNIKAGFRYPSPQVGSNSTSLTAGLYSSQKYRWK